MKGILSRLEVLERGHLVDHVVVLASDPDGNTQKMTVDELLQSDSFGFVRVASGSSLKDLDTLLNAVHQQAQKQMG